MWAAWRAFAIAFSTKVSCGSSACGTAKRDCGKASIPRGSRSAASSRSFPGLSEATTTLFNSGGNEGLALARYQLADPAGREIEKARHLLAREGFALGGALDLDETARACHH